MNTTIPKIRVQHSVPSSKQLGDIIRSAFGLPSSSNCKFIYQGSNDIYKVQTSEENCFARLARTGARNKEQINAELQILHHLNEQGLDVASPLRSVTNNQTLEIAAPEGTRYLNLFTEAKGRVNSTPSKLDIETIGQTLGRLHLAAERTPLFSELPIYDVETCANRSCMTISRFLRSDHEIRKFGAFFLSISQSLKKALAALPLEEFSWGIIHGDFVTCNIHKIRDGQISLFDFERVGYGWHAYEVGAYIGHIASNSKLSHFPVIYQRFIKGYESVKQLSKAEKEAIPIFHLMRRLWIRGICCAQYEDWSNSFMNTENWEDEVKKLKRWIQAFHLFHP